MGNGLILNPIQKFGAEGVEVPVPTVFEYIVPTNRNPLRIDVNYLRVTHTLTHKHTHLHPTHECVSNEACGIDMNSPAIRHLTFVHRGPIFCSEYDPA